MTRTALALTALALTALVLTGCTDKPAPTSTSASSATVVPTTKAPTDLLQTNVDEARNAYLNYVEVSNHVTQDFFRNWDTKFLDLTTGEERMAVTTSWSALADQGYHAEGSVVVTVPEILVYEDSDPLGNYRAEMRSCVDTGGVELVAEGRDTIQPSPDGRFYFMIVMQRMVSYDAEGNVLQDPQAQGWWRVASDFGDSDRPC